MFLRVTKSFSIISGTTTRTVTRASKAEASLALLVLSLKKRRRKHTNHRPHRQVLTLPLPVPRVRMMVQDYQRLCQSSQALYRNCTQWSMPLDPSKVLVALLRLTCTVRRKAVCSMLDMWCTTKRGPAFTCFCVDMLGKCSYDMSLPLHWNSCKPMILIVRLHIAFYLQSFPLNRGG